MSFVRALAAVAVGFAAAKGVDRYRKMGGMAGLQDQLKNAGTSDLAGQLGKLADQFGVPGGSARVRDMMGQMGTATASATEASAVGLGSLMNTMRGASEAGGQRASEMMEAVFGQTPVADAMEQQAKLMIRAMIQAAKADGEIDDAEKMAILDKVGEIGAEERAFIQAELQAPMDLQGLVRDAGDVGREQVYSTSLAAIRLDNTAEATYLRQLATGLGLSDAQRDAIHDRMGVARLS